MDEKTKKKNVLDLHFQKYLVIASTSVIIAFSYTIGVGIALFTKQIELDNFVSMGALFVISIGVVGICATLFFNATHHLKNIPRILRDL